MKTIRVGSDFSGVGAFDFAINRVAEQKGFKVQNVFACDWDKYARKSYLANHDAPEYYPYDVYQRDIPEQPLDVYMTSPPCQGFSLAGSRKSKEDDKRNILFYNSHEFIVKNKPRYFVFENVRGLLSHENGSTFREWINLLCGKSVNGLPVLFPHDESVPYHVYYAVLNTKKIANIPQNRERVFIIGIRDDVDNYFRFPKEQSLTIKLKDILEINVDKKYIVNFNEKYNEIIKQSLKQNYSTCIDASYYKGFGVRQGKCRQVVEYKNKVRRLTPRECFRLQGFNDSFKFVVSNSQLYKQAGNSITIDVLEKILNKLTF
jgi:DNA (cytosine-5)-methyltransferase 1